MAWYCQYWGKCLYPLNKMEIQLEWVYMHAVKVMMYSIPFAIRWKCNFCCSWKKHTHTHTHTRKNKKENQFHFLFSLLLCSLSFPLLLPSVFPLFIFFLLSPYRRIFFLSSSPPYRFLYMSLFPFTPLSFPFYAFNDSLSILFPLSLPSVIQGPLSLLTPASDILFPLSLASDF